MKLTRNKIFIGILAFLLVVNILVWFDINYFYIRAALAFIFLITIPGLLIMLMFRIRKINFWEYLVYTVGLSVSFIMFAGLAVNWTLPWLHITDKPLSLIPILTSFNLFLLIFWFVAFYRNKDLKFEIKSPKLDWTNRIFIIVPMLFPVLSILGALILNNFGPNYLTMFMLGGIAVYVLMIVIFRKKINDNVWPWALWMICLALLLSFSLRGNNVTGWDVQQENLVFQLTLKNSVWSINSFKDAYNACISVTILPTIFYYFVIKNPMIFKFFFQIVFSFTIIALFLFNRKFLNRSLSFIAAFIFLSAVGFIDMSSLLRQEIAFLFFGILLLNLFNKKNKNKALILIMFSSITISHYSTTYITLFLVIFGYLLFFILTTTISKFKTNKIKKKSNIDFILILIFLLSAFLWHSQLTDTAQGAIKIIKESYLNLGKIFSEELRAEGTSFKDQFNIFYKPKDNTRFFEEYKIETTVKYANLSYQLYQNEANYRTRSIIPETIPIKINQKFASFVFVLQKIIKIIIVLLMLFGLFSFIYGRLKKDSEELDYASFSFILVILIGLFLIFPIFSLNYPIERLYQQLLFLLGIHVVLGSIVIFSFTKRNFKNLYIYLITSLILLSFFYSSGAIPQITGGGIPSPWLNTYGKLAEESIVPQADIFSAEWISQKGDLNESLYADRISQKRLYSAGILTRTKQEILPNFIEKNSYVYSSFMNKVKRRGSIKYSGRGIDLSFPTEFLNDNKNKIYNNGGSEIFR